MGGSPQFRGAKGVAVDAAGSIFVADTLNNRRPGVRGGRLGFRDGDGVRSGEPVGGASVTAAHTTTITPNLA